MSSTQLSYIGIDGFNSENHPYAQHHQFISQFYATEYTGTSYEINPNSLFQYIDKLNNQARITFLFAALERMVHNEKHQDQYDWSRYHWHKQVLKCIYCRILLLNNLTFLEDEMITYFQLVDNNYTKEKVIEWAELRTFFPVISDFFQANPNASQLKAVMQKAKESFYTTNPPPYSHNTDLFAFLIDNAIGEHDWVSQMREYTDDTFGKGELLGKAMDDFPYFSEDPYLEQHQVLSNILQSCKSEGFSSYNPQFKNIETGKILFESSRENQLSFIYAVLYRIAWNKVMYKDGYSSWNYELLKQLMKKKLPYQEADICWIANCISKLINNHWNFPFLYFTKYTLAYVKEKGKTPALIQAMTDLHNQGSLAAGYYTKETEKIKSRIMEVIQYGDFDTEIEPFWLHEKDQSFGKKINDYIKSIDKEDQIKWFTLFKHLSKSSGSKPSAKFKKEMVKLVNDIGLSNFSTHLKHWLSSLFKKGSFNIENWEDWDYIQLNKELQKGLVWATIHAADSELLRIIAGLAERSFQTIPGHGPLAASLGNACIYVLGTLEGLESVSHLSRLKLKIRQNNTRKLIARYIQGAADRLGISEGEIEDISTPDFGLEDGVLKVALGDQIAVVCIEAIGKTTLKWQKPDGKLQKSVPASVKKDYAQDLKELRINIKEIQKTMTAQRDRIDRSFVQERSWSWEKFQTYFFRHGLMSFITKKLIWEFDLGETRVVGIWENTQFVDHQSNALAIDFEQTTVRLWHPIHATIDQVLAWRTYLENKEILQPLKQAFREVYIVTAAELNTATYSNRFAAHILKQHQFNSLAKLRGWEYSLMGAYDDGIDNTICAINLPAYNLKAEFWIDEMNADDSFTDSGIWQYVATDQVRFKQGETSIAMADVPKMAFSEIMRDTDMFVGVASIGNDPNWQDHGDNRRMFNYWQTYSFGDLSESAKTRKMALERLVPRLKIADKCSFDNKFLIVEGKLRTYKIHMGSGNILMAPNDEYLCIVPQRNEKASEKVFLPFEGDKILSIILSKAMLLANDDTIDDSTITSQINRK